MIRYSHAARHTQGSHDGRQDADNELNDKFPGFLSHKMKFKIYKFKIQKPPINSCATAAALTPP